MEKDNPWQSFYWVMCTFYLWQMSTLSTQHMRWFKKRELVKWISVFKVNDKTGGYLSVCKFCYWPQISWTIISIVHVFVCTEKCFMSPTKSDSLAISSLYFQWHGQRMKMCFIIKKTWWLKKNISKLDNFVKTLKSFSIHRILFWRKKKQCYFF